MSEHKRKFLLLAFLGIVITLIAYQTAIDAQDTANTALNMTCTPIINNTDLAPLKGDGERVSGVTYYANDTPRHVYIILVNPNPSTDIDIDFYINGTRVQDDDLRTTIVNQNVSKYFNVPLGASYRANISTSNYQWIEYKQLCNRPGTLTITNVFANNTTFVPYTGATNNVDITPFTINASGFNAFGDSDFNRFNISNIRNIIGDHLHIITNASVDDYFNTFSAGNSTNISSIRASSNATTIASMEQCTGGCHSLNISWIRVWPAYIDVSSPHVYLTGNISAQNMNASGGINVTGDSTINGNVTISDGDTLLTKNITTVLNTTGGFSWEMLDSSSALRILPNGGINYIQTGTSLGSGSKTRLKFTSMFATQSYLTINAPSTNVSVDTGNLIVVGAGKGILLKSPSGLVCMMITARDDGTGIDSVQAPCNSN